MNSRKKTRIVLSVISTGLLSIVCASSQAGIRALRAGDSFVPGAFWGNDNEQSGARASRPEKQIQTEDQP
jgi:hypothetical protein